MLDNEATNQACDHCRINRQVGEKIKRVRRIMVDVTNRDEHCKTAKAGQGNAGKVAETVELGSSGVSDKG